MENLLSIEQFITESKLQFSPQQIRESLEYLNSEDPQLLEHWYNTVLDFAALIPGVGSVAEGINLVSYAKQGEYLLAGLCAIGLIPIFGQYIGAGGTLLVKALGKGASIGGTILKPLINLVAKFFPKIAAFFKSAKFTSKFAGIAPYTGKMLGSLKNFVTSGGAKLTTLAKDTSKIRALKKEARNLKTGVKFTEWIFGDKTPRMPSTASASSYGGYGVSSSQYQIPVPKDAYMSYQGTPLQNIRPYTDMEISQAEMAQDWSQYL
jgi:hypothetical protein